MQFIYTQQPSSFVLSSTRDVSAEIPNCSSESLILGMKSGMFII